MDIRILTQFEKEFIDKMVLAGEKTEWEFAAFLETPDGPLIELISRMQDNGADPSLDVHNKAKTLRTIVTHHNHLRDKSLGCADWYGTATIFHEIYAHCSDGTIYYGHVIDVNRIKNLGNRLKGDLLEEAEKHLTKELNANFFHPCLNKFDNPIIASFFDREVLNRALRIKCLVDYGCQWGTACTYSSSVDALNILGINNLGELGKMFESHIEASAQDFANLKWW
ncbi:hypothetical protein ACIPR9_18490 [Pectobacterium punjabense]|uniref:hypothetical protein n=1 Tax=Pectobacterium punjabense TaxID=2108399 RepID=UPI0037FAFDAF